MSIFDASQFMFNNPSFYNNVVKQSARFDGDAGINITHSSAPTLQTKGTVAVWIKLHDNFESDCPMCRKPIFEINKKNSNDTIVVLE